MAKITENKRESILSIKKWLGINETGSALREGEGERCENFRVTDGGLLQKRPGSRSAALLTQSFKPVVTETETIVKSWGEPSKTLRLYPRVEATGAETLALKGARFDADFWQSANHTGWYLDTVDNVVTGIAELFPVSQLYSATVSEREKTETKEARYSGQPKSEWSGEMEDYIYAWFILYDSLKWNGYEYVGENPQIVNNGDFSAFDGTRFTVLTSDNRPVSFFRKPAQKPTEADYLAEATKAGYIGKPKLNSSHDNYMSVTDTPLWSLWLKVDVLKETEYIWTLRSLAVEPNPAEDIAVKALWTGIVGGSERIVAACSGALWSLSGSGASLERVQLGTVDTSGAVTLFGFEDKLYILAAGQYKVWDGETVLPVRAYPPYVPPSDPEEEASPDYITDGSAAKMRCAEIFSGAKGARVMLCGDGTNRIIYSGFDEGGRARADSFPAGNELLVGDANTPVTALIRHYDRLLCFKKGSAWVITPDGNGFSVSPMNRAVGCDAMGEAMIVNNRPRTPDGGSIMEWTNAALTGSYRNAKSISDRVKVTLSSFPMEEVRTFYDKYSGEYYVISPDCRALVHNTVIDAWYLYTRFDAAELISFHGLVYFGTRDGHVRLLSREFCDDEGEAIACRWESGAAELGSEYAFKRALGLWLALDAGEKAAVSVSVITNAGETKPVRVETDALALPRTRLIRIKTGKASHFKLAVTSESANESATVQFIDLRAIRGGYAR